MPVHKYSTEAVDAFFDALMTIDDETGLRPSVAEAAAAAGLTKKTIYNWIAKYEEFRDRYVKTIQITSVMMFEEMMNIADDSSKDTKINNFGERVEDKEWTNRSRLRVEARRWALSRLMPKVFGDKVDVNVNATKEIIITGKKFAELDEGIEDAVIVPDAAIPAPTAFLDSEHSDNEYQD